MQQFISFGGSNLVCAGQTGFPERFYFVNLAFGIAMNFSAVIKSNKQRILEKMHPRKRSLRMTLCCAVQQDARLKKNWRFTRRFWKKEA